MRQPGERIGRYEIEAFLGQGGMAQVYAARDTGLGRVVALKLVLGASDREARARLLREAQAAAQLSHPHAVTVYDVGEEGDEAFIAMELVRGKSLRALVGDLAVPVARRVRYLLEVAEALSAAHKAGLVHRDIKPDNVMLREDGAIKVLDFGIARKLASAVDPSAPTESGDVLKTLTERGMVVGTPRYASPEQLLGKPLDGRSDQFSWGVMAYELLSGEIPWSATDGVTLVAQVLESSPPRLSAKAPDLPSGLVAVVERAMSKEATGRFASFGALIAELSPYAESAVSGVRSGATTQAVAGVEAERVATLPVKVLRGGMRVTVIALASLGALLLGAALLAASVGRGGNVQVSYTAANKPVASLRCDAGAGDEMARAVQMGACARLGVALGVDWGAGPSGERFEATATKVDGGVEVKLKVGDARARGKGATALDAITAAVGEATKTLKAPAPTAERVAAWGAKDEASALAIERAYRRLVTHLSSDDYEAEIKALREADPQSPWPHALFSLVALAGSEPQREARDRAIALCDRLPSARSSALRGTMIIVGAPSERKEALKLLRKAYAEAPDDPEVASLFAAIAIGAGAPDEGLGVVDRLVERYPHKSVLSVLNAISAAPTRDVARNMRYVEALGRILPESRAWETPVRTLVLSGKVDEARAALSFGEAFGLSGRSADRATIEGTRAWLELVARRPDEARQRASALLGDPRAQVATWGAELTIASYLLEGRLDDAHTALSREIERQRAVGSALVAASFELGALMDARLIGAPPPKAERLAEIEKTFSEARESSAGTMTRVEVEVALARLTADPKGARAQAEATLAKATARADEQAEGDRATRDTILLRTLPLVRALRGDAAAAARWRESDRAKQFIRRTMAIEGALVLSAVGDDEGALSAYKLATDAEQIEGNALAALVAESKMAALLRKQGKAAEAGALEAELTRLLARADGGFREKLDRVR